MRYVNDERICQAVVAMLARVGVKVSLNAQTRSKHFDKVLTRNTSFYLIGWMPATYDAHNPLVMVTPNGVEGTFNLGGYSTPRVDERTHKIQVETDPARRQAMIREALRIHRDGVGHLPRHDQRLAWGLKSTVAVSQTADNILKLQWVRMESPTLGAGSARLDCISRVSLER